MPQFWIRDPESPLGHDAAIASLKLLAYRLIPSTGRRGICRLFIRCHAAPSHPHLSSEIHQSIHEMLITNPAGDMKTAMARKSQAKRQRLKLLPKSKSKKHT